MAWTQASIPVSKGGLAIRMTEQVALPAYLASTHFALPFVPQSCRENLSEESTLAIIECIVRTSVSGLETAAVQKAWINR